MSKSIKLKNNIYLDNRSIKNNYIQVANNQNETISNEWQQLSLNSWSDGYGNALTLSNNRVYIGSGIKKVRVSGSIFCEGVGNIGYIWCIVRKNGIYEMAKPILSSTTYFNSLNIPPHTFEVYEGDYIDILLNNPSFSTTSFSVRHGADNTWLLVEVIG